MTAKRFMIAKNVILEYPYAIRDNIELLDQEEVCDLLNELHEENEQLKSFNKYLNELLKDLNGVSIEIEKVI